MAGNRRSSDVKKSTNNWLGLFATDAHFSYVEKVFRSEDTFPAYAGVSRQHAYECGLTSVGYAVQQYTCRTHRPFHQWVIDQEHLLMAQLLHMLQHELGFLKGLPQRAFKELRVDSILLQGGVRKHKEVCQKITNLTWKALAGSDCEDAIARAEIIDTNSKTILDFTPALPNSSGEEPQAIPWWKDLNEEEARVAIKRGESLNIASIAGTGKTFLCKDIIRELRENNEKVEIIARCHVAAKALNGTTADKFILSKLGSFRCGTLMIEESGQVPHYIWCQLCALKKLGIRFVCLGDITNQ